MIPPIERLLRRCTEEPVTRQVNTDRGLRRKGYRDPKCPNGHDYTPENTRVIAGGYRRCRICTERKRAAA